MTITQEYVKPTCPKCGSGFIYVLIDGTIRCRQCGNSTIKPTDKIGQKTVNAIVYEQKLEPV